MRPLVVLVGHTVKKLERLKKLYYNNKPFIKHDTVVVYNGEDKNYKCDLRTKNDQQGRDVYMYHKAVMKWKRDFYFFMNDDTVHIGGHGWLIWACCVNKEIAGMQTNLSSFVSIEQIKEITGKFPEKWKRWEGVAQFIRTSSFGCTRKYFLTLWKVSGGNAQRFEKKTLQITNNYIVFPDPFYIHDSNLAPYFKYFGRR